MRVCDAWDGASGLDLQTHSYCADVSELIQPEGTGETALPTNDMLMPPNLREQLLASLTIHSAHVLLVTLSFRGAISVGTTT